ncbi:monocarboxylate transporter 12 [Rhipicephalus sanguineus]|uniref:monocarboxylate transporter 12 n=1 Tax=Rhipicephalus sanguineus TaxID=34632 RepID=UPI0020C37435|nr:monocarboxylate transporter 12 [Rhipicephalus sanguineus]
MAESDAVAMDAGTSKSLRHRLQDSRRSWFTLAMCMVMSHTATLGNRSQGAMYVGIREHFGASHGEASFPPSLQASLCLVGGVFTGFLCEVIPLRYMSLGSSLLSSLALIVCYFGLTVSFISFFFGAVHGLAVSGMYVVTSVVVGEYFVRWRATAYGLSAAAKSSHFLTPFVANHIRVHYGTPEIFLLLGALSLNGFVASLLVKTPPWRLPFKSKDAVLTRSNAGVGKEHCPARVQDTETDVTLTGVDGFTTADVAFASEPLLEEVSLDQQDRGSRRTLSGPVMSFQEQCLPVTVTTPRNVSSAYSEAQHTVDERTAVDFSISATPWGKIIAFLRGTVNTFFRIDWKIIVSPLFLFDTLSVSLHNYVLSNFVLLYLDVTIDIQS